MNLSAARPRGESADADGNNAPPRASGANTANGSGFDSRARLNLLSDEDLAGLELHLRRVLARALAPADDSQADSQAHARADAPAGVSPLRDAVSAYVLHGGKRLRPQLCVWTFRCAVGGREWVVGGEEREAREENAARPSPPTTYSLPPTPLLDLACAWELFHAFLLVHDDIIDGADRRRDRPSLHRHLQSLDSDCARFGVNLGIVAGDLLFGAAMRLWHEADLPPDQYRAALRLFSRIACTTGFGQAVDIVQGHVPLDEVREHTLLREYHWKTAAYTFEGPMLTAAILAGLGEGARAAISRFALALGQAYQLHNDVADLLAPAHEGCDLVQGKRTVTLIRARAAMAGPDRRSLDRRLDELGGVGGREGVRLAETLRRELISQGAAGRTRALVDEFLLTAAAAARDPALPPALATGLTGLLGTLRHGYFADAETQTFTASPVPGGPVPALAP